MTYRVIHHGTGPAGIHALRGIISHPGLELVGVVVPGDDEAGRDAGELAGVGPTGVVATKGLDEVLRLDADAFCYMAPTHGRIQAAIGELNRILEAGKNVTTTSFGLSALILFSNTFVSTTYFFASVVIIISPFVDQDFS